MILNYEIHEPEMNLCGTTGACMFNEIKLD